MRQFGSSGFRLWNLGLEAKVLYSAFCILTFFGVISSALYYGDLVGAGTRGIRRYYAGETREPEQDTAAAAGAASPASGGPAIELPEDADRSRPPIIVAVTYRKLLEVTHFHLFTMPVVLLIVGHLFLATGLGDRTKVVWIVAGSASVFAHLATPWAVRYLGGGLAWLHALSGAALTVTMTVLTMYPLFAMWKRRSKVSSRTEARAP